MPRLTFFALGAFAGAIAFRTDYFADWDLVYWLGPERGMIRIDSEWLVVRFGPDGRVREYRIVRD